LSNEPHSPERDLYPPLLSFLCSEWGLDENTLLAEEVSLHGRFVDLALLVPAAGSVAFEFKVAATKRALEQAAFNRLSFHESYVVLGVVPSKKNLGLAQQLGIGVIYVGREGARSLIVGKRSEPGEAINQRVTRRIQSRLGVV
jgi:hypothetical protein